MFEANKYNQGVEFTQVDKAYFEENNLALISIYYFMHYITCNFTTYFLLKQLDQAKNNIIL